MLKIKRLLALILTLVICLSFAACETDSRNDDDDDDDEDESSSTVLEIEDESDVITTTSTPTTTTSSNITSVKPKPVPKTLYLGTLSSNKWESNYYGIGFKLLSGWSFYTKDQIATVNGVTTDKLTKPVSEIMSGKSLVYDVVAFDSIGSTVTIIYEKVDSSMTISKYINIAVPDVKTVLANSGATNVNVASSTCRFAGSQTPCINTTCTMNGVDVYQTQAYFKVDNYMCIITCSSSNESTKTALVNSFYSL